MKPNLFILGVGHSGTSVLARMLYAVGWKANDADVEFAESMGFRRLNERLLNGEELRVPMRRFLDGLGEPWCLKDPRFVLTWRRWAEVRAGAALLWIARNYHDVVDSYERRDERLPDGRPGLYGKTVADLFVAAEECFEFWLGPKLRVEYEQLATAITLFDLERAA